jgi:gas vesicle protein
MRGLKTWLMGLFTGAALGAAAYYLLRDGLPKETRQRVNEAVGDAVEAGKKAASKRKAELEDRFDELVGTNGKK